MIAVIKQPPQQFAERQGVPLGDRLGTFGIRLCRPLSHPPHSVGPGAPLQRHFSQTT